MARAATLVCVSVALLLFILFFSRYKRPTRSLSSPRHFVCPLVFLCDHEALRRQALESAVWPESVRVMRQTSCAERDVRMSVAADGTLELFPGWDRMARRSARNGDLVSHCIRRCLRALAFSETPDALPRTEDERTECPDVRLLIGPCDLVTAALSMTLGEDDGLEKGRIVAHWMRECDLSLGFCESEIAFEPGESLE
jgi:hypothetical protein